MKSEFDHVALAVRDAEAVFQFFRAIFDVDPATVHRQDWPNLGFNALQFQLGASQVELLEPNGEQGLIGRYLERHGEGVHHVTFAVADLNAQIEQLNEQGVATFGTGQQSAGWYETFIHPREAHGVLIQFCERR